MKAKLRGIEGTKKELDKINKKIHEYMIETITDYNAEQWTEVIKHRTLSNKYILMMSKDNRSPEKILSSKEKLLIKSNIIARNYIKQSDEV